ncbi:zinc-binding dehydrogenase [Vibrio sp. M60_M31a]
MGAKAILASTDEQAMQATASSFDLIIDTVPTKHDVNLYTPLLDLDGSLVIVGQVGPLDELMSVPLVFGRRRVAGSLIGGIAETQELLDFCADHDIYPECEMIKMNEINDAFKQLASGDLAHRFVIDMSSLA